MQNIGYARVSSRGQSLELQMEKLQNCQKIFKEKASGVDGKRPQLKACLNYVRQGDVLIVTRLDRLARSTTHLWKIVETLNEKEVELKVLDQNLDTGTSTGRLLFNMLGAIAQFENEIRAERQMDGVKRAKERGVQFGRKNKITNEEHRALITKRKAGVKICDLMKEYGLSHKSVYNYLSRSPHETTPKTHA